MQAPELIAATLRRYDATIAAYEALPEAEREGAAYEAHEDALLRVLPDLAEAVRDSLPVLTEIPEFAETLVYLDVVFPKLSMGEGFRFREFLAAAGRETEAGRILESVYLAEEEDMRDPWPWVRADGERVKDAESIWENRADLRFDPRPGIGEEDACTRCGDDLTDGEGFDGLCGNHADQAEQAGAWS